MDTERRTHAHHEPSSRCSLTQAGHANGAPRLSKVAYRGSRSLWQGRKWQGARLFADAVSRGRNTTEKQNVPNSSDQPCIRDPGSSQATATTMPHGNPQIPFISRPEEKKRLSVHKMLGRRMPLLVVQRLHWFIKADSTYKKQAYEPVFRTV